MTLKKYKELTAPAPKPVIKPITASPLPSSSKVGIIQKPNTVSTLKPTIQNTKNIATTKPPTPTPSKQNIAAKPTEDEDDEDDDED